MQARMSGSTYYFIIRGGAIVHQTAEQWTFEVQIAPH